MIEEKKRNDFIFFQDEILGELKKMETKLSEKLTQSLSFIDNQNQKFDNKIKDLNNRFNMVCQKIEEQINAKKAEDSSHQSHQKLEELVSKIDIKLNILDKDFNNACYKYDKIFSNNLIVPGLIGSSCPYDNLKPFLEYVNIKMSELLKAKDKQTLDTKKYKEKLETIISQNKTQFETAQKKINDYCSKGFKQCDIICQDRITLLEKRIESLRLENGEYAYELKQKTEEIRIDWDKLNKIDSTLTKKYNEEWNKYNELVDKLSNKIEKYREEFNVIKNKFTELSEFIKDVRFRKNLGDVNGEEINVGKRQYKEMSNRIDFSKQRKKMKRMQNYEIRNEKEVMLSPSYNNNNQEYLIQDNEMQIKNIPNFNEYNNINEIIPNNYNNIYENKKDEEIINNIKENKQDIKQEIKQEIKREIQKEFKQEKKFINEIDEKNKIKYNIFQNINNSNNIKNEDVKIKNNKDKKIINDIHINNSSEFQNISNNIISNNIISNNINSFKADKREDIKFINIKSKKNHQNDNNTYNIINYNNNFNNINKNINYNEIKSNNSSPSNYEKNNIIENKEDNQNNLLILSEKIKINDLVLGADFKGKDLYNTNGPSYNLSQAYILFKRKDDDNKKIKKNQAGKSDSKFNQIASSSIKTNSRNVNIFNNKTSKKESFYNSSLKKNKLKNIGLNQNINLNLADKENLNNVDKKNFPKIIKDNQRQIHENNIEKNYMHISYINNLPKKNQNHSNNSNSIIDNNTINIQDNSPNNKSSSQKGKNTKKMLNSFSDKSLLVKISSVTPNYKEHISIDNDNINLKRQKYSVEINAKEKLNHIRPYLIKKFKDI